LTLSDLLMGTKAQVHRTTLDGLLQGLATSGELENEISACVVDSRRAAPGSIFFALKGEKVDGHAFVGDALARGAIGAVVERPIDGPLPPNKLMLFATSSLRGLQDAAAYWRGKHDLAVIGVTGSVGKTTVKEAIAQALTPLGEARILKTEANLNTEIGLPMELLRLNRAHKVAVLEMGMYQRGDIALLAKIARPQMGVITNVQPSHLERTGSIQNTARAKAELAHALPRDGLAVLNGDDRLVRAMAWATPAASVFYGTEGRGDFVARDVEGLGQSGFRTTIVHGARRFPVCCPTPGRHNAINLLPAVAVAHRFGVSWNSVQAALNEFRLTGRAEFIPGPRGSTLLDDRYNASAASMIAALNLLREVPGRRMAMLGEMLELGELEEEQHRMVGRHTADLDRLLLLGQRTRWIAEEAERAGLPAERIVQLGDNGQAVEAAVEALGPGDVMLIKGSRGLELESVVEVLANLDGSRAS